MTSSGRDQAEGERVDIAQFRRDVRERSVQPGWLDSVGVLDELDRLRAENERLRAARDRVLAACDEEQAGLIAGMAMLDVAEVRALLDPVSTDTDEPRGAELCPTN